MVSFGCSVRAIATNARWKNKLLQPTFSQIYRAIKSHFQSQCQFHIRNEVTFTLERIGNFYGICHNSSKHRDTSTHKARQNDQICTNSNHERNKSESIAKFDIE